jgi:hypothetical protein
MRDFQPGDLVRITKGENTNYWDLVDRVKLNGVILASGLFYSNSFLERIEPARLNLRAKLAREAEEDQ